MARLEEKIGEIADAKLRDDIRAEVATLKKNTRFGLVFEQHQPERVPLYAHKIRRDDRVAKRSGSLNDTWRVRALHDDMADCVKEPDGIAMESFPVASLVAIRTMGEPIFPALIPMGAVRRANKLGDSAPRNSQSAQVPNHVLIEADNFHALQLLLFAYEGKVDCIYIDPPYNTGARDWKYNNDYVDGNDRWRHSKWLSMMQRRLKLAARLLNPVGSVLIVTIDEKEYLRIGLLLEQLFPSCKIQMTTIVINPKGTARYNEFARVEEYAFFVFIGGVRLQSFGSDMLTERDYSSETHVRWRGLARTGRKGLRSNNPGSWYPIFINKSDSSIHSIGDAIGRDEKESSVSVPKGTIAVWPPSSNGQQFSWSSVPETLRAVHAKGGFKTGRVNQEKGSYPFYYLSSGLFDKIEKGEITVTGRGQANELILEFAAGLKSAMPRSVWNKVAFDAGSHGTGLVQQILPVSTFPFPKSIYAVRDSIRFFVADKPNALILDFFAGSGTTLNAVNLLNAVNGGQRQCILVTNNEVSEAEATALAARGIQPGEPDWEVQGICRNVTWPRSKFTINGQRDDGTPLPGEYLTGKTKTVERIRSVRQLGIVEGRTLTVPQRKQLAAVMEGVPQSKVSDTPWLLDEEMGVSVLWDVQQGEAWCNALTESGEHIHTAIIVTTDKRQFEALREHVLDALGPITEEVEDKRPLAAGFAANLEYFKLDFLDPREVQLGRQFAGVLPVLWMMAGAKGTRPEAPTPTVPWLIPVDCPFAVLLHEGRSKPFFEHIAGRNDLTHVFFVTNSHDAFVSFKREMGRNGVRTVQLYRDYLENFKINTGEGDAA